MGVKAKQKWPLAVQSSQCWGRAAVAKQHGTHTADFLYYVWACKDWLYDFCCFHLFHLFMCPTAWRHLSVCSLRQSCALRPEYRVMTTNELFTFQILPWGRAFWEMSLVSNAHAENIHCTVLSTPRLSPYSLTCSLPVLQLLSQTPPPPAREQHIEWRAAVSRWRLDSKPSSWNTKPTPWVQPVPSRTTHLP